jgi:putative membrane protein
MQLQDLPLINAILNSCSALLLLAGYVAIKRDQKERHKRCMVAALITSTLFLTCYVIYHVGMQRVYGSAHTRFVDPAWFRPWYLALLASHLLLAIAIVPMVLMTVYHAIRGNFEKHRKIARWTWPCWMYVSVTGVVIYLLLYRIFPQTPAVAA